MADPNDPRRWRLHSPTKKDTPESYRNVQDKLLLSLEKLALAGLLKCRAEIEAALIKAGWIISRRTKNFISVSHARLKKPIRLAGRMFALQWRGVMPADAILRLGGEFEAARTQRLRATVDALAALLETRASYNAKRYGDPSDVKAFIRQLRAAADSEVTQGDQRAALSAELAEMQRHFGSECAALRALGKRTRQKMTPAAERDSKPTDTRIFGGPRHR